MHSKSVSLAPGACGVLTVGLPGLFGRPCRTAVVDPHQVEKRSSTPSGRCGTAPLVPAPTAALRPPGDPRAGDQGCASSPRRPSRLAACAVLARGLLLLLSAVLLLTACTARWQAPLETRGQRIPAIDPRAEIYRVKRGDTLAAIASGVRVDWRTLAEWNRLRPPYTIMPGQVLRLRPPPRVNVTAMPRRPSVSPVPARRTTQPVQKPKTVPTPPKRAPARREALRWVWPTAGEVLATAPQPDAANKGVSIRGKLGQSVRAAESGQVVYSGSGLIGYGRLIILKHNDKYLSAYGHNRKILVKEGDQVAKGDRIAEMGTSNGGRPMLHFEIRRDGKSVDPLKLLPRSR